MTKKKGFTLIELAVVLCILATLAALIFPSFNWYRQRAQMQSMLSVGASLNKAFAIYYAENGNLDGLTVPPNGGEITANAGPLGVNLPDDNNFTYQINVMPSQTGSGAVLAVITMDPPGPPMGCDVAGTFNPNRGLTRISQFTDPQNRFRLNSNATVIADLQNEFGYSPLQNINP